MYFTNKTFGFRHNISSRYSSLYESNKALYKDRYNVHVFIIYIVLHCMRQCILINHNLLCIIHSDGTPPEYFPQIGAFKYKLL